MRLPPAASLAGGCNWLPQSRDALGKVRPLSLISHPTATQRKSRKRESGRQSCVIVLNKPYGVACRFSDDGSGKPTLAAFVPVPGVYPAGRLDTDSEGIVVLTGDGAMQARIADPAHKVAKTYWVQVEGVPGEPALDQLRQGVALRDLVTAPATVGVIPDPGLWPRHPPIRVRREIPTAWLEIVLREGKNRQVRRMTAAVGHPTLRLIRVAVGPWRLDGLEPGAWRREPGGDRVL